MLRAFDRLLAAAWDWGFVGGAIPPMKGLPEVVG